MCPTESGQLKEFANTLLVHIIKTHWKCPLMDYVVERYGGSSEKTPTLLTSQVRTFHYCMWCGRRALISCCRDHESYAEILQAYDLRMQAFVYEMCQRDEACTESAIDALAAIFKGFDDALERDDGPGWVWWLGTTALDFINEGPSDLGLSPDECVKWGLMVNLPAKVMISLHQDIRAMISQQLGIGK